jgi:hypothetical protein
MPRLRSLTFAVALSTAVGIVTPAPAFGATGRGSAEPRSVELLENGKAPREPLRLTPSAGTSASSIISFVLTIEQTLGDERVLDLETPEMQLPFETTIQSVDGAGNATMGFAYGAPTVGTGGDRQVAEQLEQTLPALAGIGSSITVDPRGTLVDGALGVSGEASGGAEILASLNDQLAQLSVPFPEEAVGVGARWRARATLDLNGVEVRSTFVYTLRGRDGGRIELSVRITQTARDQPVESSALPSGTDVRITSYKNKGRGSVTFDLAQVLATQSEISLSGRHVFAVEQSGDEQQLEQRFTSRLGFAAT